MHLIKIFLDKPFSHFNCIIKGFKGKQRRGIVESTDSLESVEFFVKSIPQWLASHVGEIFCRQGKKGLCKGDGFFSGWRLILPS